MFRRLVSFLRFNQRRAITSTSFEGYKTTVGKKSRIFYTSGSFYALSLWKAKKTEENESSMTTKELLIAKADALFEQEEYKQIYDLLSGFKNSKNVEILWRLSRAMYKMSLSATDVEGKKIIFEAYNIISSALEIDENNWAAQKWMAIILDAKSGFEGMKSRINQLHNVKKHMIKASELNPKDATTLYLIGNWCYQISDLTWYQRKIASAIFGQPPTSSYEEALIYFEKAEIVDPNFYSQNLLMIGKTFLKLNKKEDALKYLKLASEFLAKNDEDQQAKQEAQKLLNSIS
ncbi:regulator of microtubule dynamics protein 1-like [Leptopilina boulardi]|uniref:regulator of microtubule dynamics protein 1-like n=1 Tax=Leptopilina boulardi TaxID=63433 RepID=UPI0021F60021|nr:regulator of microtubule dynamics protein 1-like [Leptopilina boulardi]